MQLHKSFLSLALVSLLTACGGGGGDSSGSPGNSTSITTPTAPIVTSTTIPQLSYENRHQADLYSDTIPLRGNARAFFKYPDGSLGYVVSTLESWPGNATPETAKPSRIVFYKKVNGQWVDNNSTQFDSANSVPGCLHPRKAIAADYNQDGKLDFAIACHGWDAPPFAGERSRVLLSQPSGQYRLDYLSDVVEFQHGGSSADINGDGYPDLIMTKQNGVDVFINDRTGHFTKSTALTIPQQRKAYHVELLDLNGDGKFDMVAGSHEWEDATRIFLNTGNNNFGTALSITVPPVPGAGVITDFLYVKSVNALYVIRTGDGQSNGTTVYQGLWVQKFTLDTRVSTVVYANAAWTDPVLTWSKWIDWAIEKNGNVQSDFGSLFQITIQ